MLGKEIASSVGVNSSTSGGIGCSPGNVLLQSTHTGSAASAEDPVDLVQRVIVSLTMFVCTNADTYISICILFYVQLLHSAHVNTCMYSHTVHTRRMLVLHVTPCTNTTHTWRCNMLNT